MLIPSAVKVPKRHSLALLPTPFHLLQRFSQSLNGPRIWIKRDDLTGCTESGNKIRKLEYTLAHAITTGCDTVITCGGIQSNHCRTTAIMAARLGLKCSLLLRGEAPAELEANTMLAAMAGAEIQFHPAQEYQRQLPQFLAQQQLTIKNKGGKAMIIPTGASDGIGIWGYIRAAFELQQDFQRCGVQPGAVIHATGSGGTQAGLTLGMHLAGMAIDIHGVNVCDDEAYFINKIHADWQDWQHRFDPERVVDIEALEPLIIDGYVGPGYAKAEPAVFTLMNRLAAEEGVLLDPIYTGKAFHALVCEIQKGRYHRDKDIVFLHTGGIFSLPAYTAQINQSLKQG